MRKEYGKVLRTEFEKFLKSEFPDFQLLKGKHQYLFPGEKAFIHKTGPAWLIIILTPNLTGHESFSIQLGWSTLGRFPELGMRPNALPSAERSEFSEPEAVIELPKLVNKDTWLIDNIADPFNPTMADLERMATPLSAEEARSMVLPLLDDACKDLVEVGRPYLEEYLDSVAK